jgi:hypothetical protein
MPALRQQRCVEREVGIGVGRQNLNQEPSVAART